MEATSKRKDSKPSHETPQRHNKQYITEITDPKKATQSMSNPGSPTGANSPLSRSPKNKSWVQSTINTQRRITASPGTLRNNNRKPPPHERAKESQQQEKNTEKPTSNDGETTAASSSTLDESRPEEELGINFGTISNEAYDMNFFLEHLPRELVTAVDKEQFTKADLHYALSQAREDIGDDSFNEFNACGTFETYLFDIIKYDNDLAHTANLSPPPEPPSRISTASKSPYRSLVRRTGSPTSSNASAAENSDLSSDSGSQQDGKKYSGLTEQEKEARLQRKHEKQQLLRQKKAAKKVAAKAAAKVARQSLSIKTKA